MGEYGHTELRDLSAALPADLQFWSTTSVEKLRAPCQAPDSVDLHLQLQLRIYRFTAVVDLELNTPNIHLTRNCPVAQEYLKDNKVSFVNSFWHWPSGRRIHSDPQGFKLLVDSAQPPSPIAQFFKALPTSSTSTAMCKYSYLFTAKIYWASVYYMFRNRYKVFVCTVWQ